MLTLVAFTTADYTKNATSLTRYPGEIFISSISAPRKAAEPSEYIGKKEPNSRRSPRIALELSPFGPGQPSPPSSIHRESSSRSISAMS